MYQKWSSGELVQVQCLMDLVQLNISSTQIKICNSTGLFYITTNVTFIRNTNFSILQGLKGFFYTKKKMKVKVKTQVFQALFNLDNGLVHLCLQVWKISLLLFSVAPSVLYQIKCFSFRQMWHFLVDGLNFVPLAFIFHFTSKFRPRSFKSQMCKARDEFVRFAVFDMSVLW